MRVFGSRSLTDEFQAHETSRRRFLGGALAVAAAFAAGGSTLAPLPEVACSEGTRSGCRAACQLFADCAAENRTVGSSLATQLSDLGFSSGSCGTCVSRCDQAATTPADAQALSCFMTKQAGAMCGAGIEGATPLFEAVNTCCNGKTTSKLCTGVCTTLWKNEAARAFFPACDALAN